MRALLRTGLSAVMALALVVPLAVEAQQTGSVGGRVIDGDTGRPLEGAQVIIVGTQRGTLTNADGLYQFVNVEAGRTQLRVINLGYASQARTVDVEPGETARANFELETSAVSLDEIVVTATGERRARELANSVGTLNTEDVAEQAPVANIFETLQGRVPGVNIQGGAGGVGIAQSIRIRGTSSISLSNTPLIYVDGVAIDNDNAEGPGVGGQNTSRINDFNPEDIERIEVIRGPAAAALYGSQASGGVIRIFTKQGRVGEPQFNLRAEYGQTHSDFVAEPNVINVGRAFGLGKDTVYSTNLWERTNPLSNGDVERLAGSVRGGADLFSYYVSGEYQHEEGTLPNNESDRYYARGNFTVRPNDEFDVQVTAGYTSNFVALPDNDNNGFGYIGVAQIDFPWVSAITAVDPNDPNAEPEETCPLAREIAREFGVSQASQIGNCEPNFDAGFGGRTFEDVASMVNRDDTERFTGSVTANYRPLDNFSNRFTVGYDQIAQREHALVPVDTDRPFGALSEGFRDIENDIRRNLSLDYVGTVNFGITEDVTSETSGGAQYFRSVREEANSFGQTFPAGATTVPNGVTRDGGEIFNEDRTIGFFGQQQFGWRDRLFLTAGVRFDRNSAFGENLEGEWYPSLGASYIVTDEAWFPQTDFLDQLKLRASWGQSGKQPGSNAALQTFDTRNVAFRGSDLLSITPGNPGNFDLQPERGEEFEVGFDFSVIGGRVGGELTYYQQTTEDALTLQTLAPSSGFSEQQWVNVGELENTGLEFALNALAVDRENFAWDLNFNISTNDNEITRLEEDIRQGFADFPQRHREGFPFGSWIFRRVFIDDSGDVTMTDEEELIGHGTPEVEAGLATTFTFFRNLSLYAFFDYKGGHHLFNNTDEFRCTLLGGSNGAICPDAWETGPDGEFTDRARMVRFAVDNNQASPFIEEADFIKLRTVSLKYRLPTEWAGRIGAAGASITVAGQNLQTWTDYSGPDPEVNGFGGAVGAQTDFLTMPQEERYVATFEVTF